jgi:hypothetical protein
MLYLKSLGNAMVVNEDSSTKVVLTSFGNIAGGIGLLYPNPKCLTSQGVCYGTCTLGSSYVRCYTKGWKTRNISRVGYKYEMDDMAPMVKRMEPDDLVYFEVWEDDENWNQY